jgi:hypothetical protein
MGNTVTKEPSPPIPSRNSIGYKNLQEKLKQIQEELFEEAIKEYEFIESENV